MSCEQKLQPLPLFWGDISVAVHPQELWYSDCSSHPRFRQGVLAWRLVLTQCPPAGWCWSHLFISGVICFLQSH